MVDPDRNIMDRSNLNFFVWIALFFLCGCDADEGSVTSVRDRSESDEHKSSPLDPEIAQILASGSFLDDDGFPLVRVTMIEGRGAKYGLPDKFIGKKGLHGSSIDRNAKSEWTVEVKGEWRAIETSDVLRREFFEDEESAALEDQNVSRLDSK